MKLKIAEFAISATCAVVGVIFGAVSLFKIDNKREKEKRAAVQGLFEGAARDNRKVRKEEVDHINSLFKKKK